MNMIRSILGRIAPLLGFRGSRHYWETRYKIGGHSGAGSRGRNAEYKADVVNRFVAEHGISTVIEFGCGDGYQLRMFEIPSYTGIDVSATVLERCRSMYDNDPGKTFILADDYRGENADLAMSLDVIYHLVENDVYQQYLDSLFKAGRRYVIIYSTSVDMAATGTPHVRHRDVASDVGTRFPGFARLLEEESRLPPPVSFDRGFPVQFMMYARIGATDVR